MGIFSLGLYLQLTATGDMHECALMEDFDRGAVYFHVGQLSFKLFEPSHAVVGKY